MSSLRLRYQTIDFGEGEIHVRTLRDNQQFSDDEQVAEKLGISSATWPLFGIVWESGKVLAQLMHGKPLEGLKVLEVGCGIGLTSLMLQQRGVDITATDYHPEAESFLEANAKLNQLEPIPFERTGWTDEDDSLGLFDLIVGSDLLYEQEHAEDLSAFIDAHLKPKGEVILVDPGRGAQGQFTKKMIALGYSHVSSELGESDEVKYKGRVLIFNRG